MKNSNFVLIAHTSCPLDLALVRKLKVSFVYDDFIRNTMNTHRLKKSCFERIDSVLSAVQLRKERET